MHLTIIAVGSQGDVQPYLALGQGLKARGHQVQMATHSNFKELVESCGLFFAEVQGNPREWLDTEEGLAWLESGPNLFGFYQGLKKFMTPVLESLLPTSFAACQQSDVILYSSLAYSGPHIGEKLKRPSFPLMLQPVYPTGEFPSVLAYSRKRTGKLFNHVTHFITDQILHHSARPSIDRWRRQALQLPPTPWLGHFRQQRKNKVAQFLGYSRHVLPRPADWEDHVHVTGYWFLTRPQDWQPPAALAEFLRSGPPPIYAGFGSMTIRQPAELTRMIVSALELSGQRGLLLGGWGNLGTVPLPKTILSIDAVPHDWLFPQVAAVIHHGGAGTTAAGLRAGRPTIVTPFFADQFFWAECIVALGAGPEYIPYSQLTAEKLARAIGLATSDVRMQATAQELGARIRAENGVENMVAAFERCTRNLSFKSAAAV